MEKIILLFHFSDGMGPFQAKQLASQIAPLGIRTQIISKEDYQRSISSLYMRAGNPTLFADPSTHSKQRNTGSELSVRMLVMCGIERGELEQLLPIFRSCGITKDDLKAMMTPTNASWTAIALAEELTREHRLMHPNS